MDVFVARQPIFNRRGDLVAYELLYRSGLHNAFPPGTDLQNASAQVIRDALTVFGYEALLGGKTGYINAADEVLRQGWYRLLPPGRTVVEVLETVAVTQDVLTACQVAKLSGYRVALDDFVYRPDLQPLLDLADIVKIDFLQTLAGTRQRARHQIGNQALALAEKVETPADFREAVEAGYDLFQGYFFARPEIVQRKDIPASKFTQLQLLKVLSQRELDFAAVEATIKHDPALSIKLLRFLNSAAFGWRSRVQTLKQALVMLGERPFRRWASLIAMSLLANDKPPALLLTCMVRARLAEALAPAAGLGETSLDAFFAGILSGADALMGRPLSELLQELRVERSVADALVGRGEGRLAQLLALALAYEKGAWDEVAAFSAQLDLSDAQVAAAYQDAVTWAQQTWQQEASPERRSA